VFIEPLPDNAHNIIYLGLNPEIFFVYGLSVCSLIGYICGISSITDVALIDG
jgi:hypothetical protein